MKLRAIEGNTQKLDGGAMFGNAPREMWKKWITPDEKNRIPLACRSLYLETDTGQKVLFDVGVGAFFDPKFRERYGVVEEEHQLIHNLKKEGISHEDIDIVILSHMHFDHAGGVLSAYSDGEPHLLFPNAKFYTGKEHWLRATNPHSRDRASFIPLIQEKLEESGRLHLIDGATHPDLDFVHFHYVHGHTPGLMISILDLPGGPLAFVADLIPGMPWVHLPISMGYDRFPELGIDEKRTFLEDFVKKQGKLFFTHDPTTPCAAVIKNEKGRFIGEALDISKITEPKPT